MYKVLFLLLLIFPHSLKAQQTPLSHEKLHQQPTFYSLEDALKVPLNVYILDLSNQNLDSLSSDISKLKNLQELSLYKNNLKTLPKELWELKNLEELVLEDNLFDKLPAEIGLLENLDMLYVGSNRLTELPEELGKLRRLSFLEAHNNQLTTLPKTLIDTELVILYVPKNLFSEAEKKAIRQLLTQCDIDF